VIFVTFAKMSSNLVVPLIIWGRQAPTHCISSILMTADQLHIVTGCNDGQLCVWGISSTDNHVWQVELGLLISFQVFILGKILLKLNAFYLATGIS